MGDECNVTSGDHDYTKNDSEGSIYIKNNKEDQASAIITKPAEYPIHYPVGDTPVGNPRITFPYISTKLRAEAPPFTLDRAVVSMKNPTHVQLDMLSINQEYDHSFVNVNLMNEDSIHGPDEEVLMPKNYPIIKEAVRDENFKLLNEASTQSPNSIFSEVEIAMNTHDVVPESSPSVAIREEIAPNQYPLRSQVLLRRFTLGNSTKIAVLIASLVISVVLIAYVFI